MEGNVFDQAQRSIWLEDQLWHKLRDTFALNSLPTEVLVTVGYPSSGARGRAAKINPCEITSQWQGNPNEKLFVSLHPAYMSDVPTAMRAMLFGMARAVYGARWGASKLGISKDENGVVNATPHTQAKLDAILADIGEPPAGFGVPFPVRHVQRARLRKYVNATKFCSDGIEKHPIIRAASVALKVTCDTCANPFVLT